MALPVHVAKRVPTETRKVQRFNLIPIVEGAAFSLFLDFVLSQDLLGNHSCYPVLDSQDLDTKHLIMSRYSGFTTGCLRLLSIASLFALDGAFAFVPSPRRFSAHQAAAYKTTMSTFPKDVVAISALVWIITAAPPMAQATDPVADGAIVFDANCAQCHSGGGNVIAQDRNLQQQALTKFLNMDPNAIQNFVQNGLVHRGALSFGSNKLTEQDFEDVAAYVVDQAAGNKW